MQAFKLLLTLLDGNERVELYTSKEVATTIGKQNTSAGKAVSFSVSQLIISEEVLITS